MTMFTFSKLVPGGNPTVILEDPVLDGQSLAELAADLMSPLHIGGEQVGALYSGQADEWSNARPDWKLPHLDMMGGEFCVNAARSAAFLLARHGSLGRLPCEAQQPVWSGKLVVSGADKPLRVLVSPDAKSLRAAMDAPELEDVGAPHPENAAGADLAVMSCAVRVHCAGVGIQATQQGVWRVDLPGMVHILADTRRYALPDLEGRAWRKESEALRLMGDVQGAQASGVVWFEALPSGAFRIWPAVAVRATASEHLESACGSAALALALALRRGLGAGCADGGVEVIQPSGQSLHVLPEKGENPARAWVDGLVRLVAQGKVFI